VPSTPASTPAVLDRPSSTPLYRGPMSCRAEPHHYHYFRHTEQGIAGVDMSSRRMA